MKYARTIDDRIPIVRIIKKPDTDMVVRFFDKEDVEFKSDEIVAVSAPGFGTTCIRKKHIIKQANSIKELCDEFVLIDKNEYETPINKELTGKSYRAMLDELKFRLSEGSDLNKMSFYGAIWTDRGLIYVAKLNEKEELELL